MAIFLCYGITRSGSTLGFETVRAALKLHGFSQEKLQLEAFRERTDNYIPASQLKSYLLKDVITASEGRFVALKTHGRASDELLGFIRSSNSPVTVSVRDPKDIIISLLEIAKKSRRRGLKDFADIVDFQDAFTVLEDQISQASTWTPLLKEGRALLVPYEILIHNRIELLNYIANVLDQQPINIKKVKGITDKVFTQFNKGISGRGHSLLKQNQISQIDNHILDCLNNNLSPFWKYSNSPDGSNSYF